MTRVCKIRKVAFHWSAPRKEERRPASKRFSAVLCELAIVLLDSVYFGFPLIVLPAMRPGRLPWVLRRSNATGHALGAPLRPAPVPPRPASQHHRAPPCPWNVWGLDSTYSLCIICIVPPKKRSRRSPTLFGRCNERSGSGCTVPSVPAPTRPARPGLDRPSPGPALGYVRVWTRHLSRVPR